MITRYTCTLNGVPLHSLDPAIHITDITEQAPRQRLVTAATPGDGLYLLRNVRESLTVRITFLIQAYDTAQRRAILQKVCAWAAKGGTLTTGDRPGQQLHTVCTALPWTSAMAWLDEMSLSLTAYAQPFWELAEAVTVTTANTAELPCPGHAGSCPVDCTITNKGTAALTALTVTAGETSITLEGISLTAGTTLTLIAEDGRLHIRTGDTSLLSHRTAASSDLLLAPCGDVCPVSVTAAQPVQALFSARGRFL